MRFDRNFCKNLRWILGCTVFQRKRKKHNHYHFIIKELPFFVVRLLQSGLYISVAWVVFKDRQCISLSFLTCRLRSDSPDLAPSNSTAKLHNPSISKSRCGQVLVADICQPRQNSIICKTESPSQQGCRFSRRILQLVGSVWWVSKFCLQVFQKLLALRSHFVEMGLIGTAGWYQICNCQIISR